MFTSGGTESNNLAILGYCLANRANGNHLVISAIEHPSVLAAAEALGQLGFRVSLLPVDAHGRVSLESLRALLTPQTLLVSVMHANNEVGTIQDIPAISALCRDVGVRLHVDACQSFRKIPVHAEELGADLISLSAHKIHGPRGVGALYVKRGTKLTGILHGGGQEGGLRPGTYNTEAIIGFAAAAEAYSATDCSRVSGLRDHLLSRLSSENRRLAVERRAK